MNIIIFAIATVVNVTLSTIRSLCTIKGGKWLSALTNALCYGFYPLIVMLTARDRVTIWTNMAITAVANFICVWLIKFIEERARKDKMWKVEMAIPAYPELNSEFSPINNRLIQNNIPYNWHLMDGWYIYNCYCMTKEQTAICTEIVKQCKGKISAYESKPLI